MRFKLSLAALAATAVAASGVTLASAHSGGPSKDHGRHSLHLFALTVQTADIDVGATGFSLGDQLVFSDDLSATEGSPKLGTDGAVCTVVRITDAATFSGVAQCVVTLSLPRGQITLQGLTAFTGDTPPAPFDIAITGGTGAYRDAGGQAHVEELSATKANITLHLTDD